MSDRKFTTYLKAIWLAPVAMILILLLAPSVRAQTAEVEEETKLSMDIYGFTMLDTGYQSGQNDPNWFDVLRPTKLPAFDNQFGEDGHWFFSVRQSRLGVKATTATPMGELKTQFEFELFGTGVDQGQTTFRLRHAYGQLGQFGAGQTWSPFMDIDVFPDTVEYWGPSGMVFFRNVQVFWRPIDDENGRMTVALERPGASGDGGVFADRIEIQNIQGHFPMPDISAEYRYIGDDWGYVEAAGIIRRIEWDDVLDDQFDLSGDATGWGINLSSNIKFGDDVVRLQYIFGEGVQNYMNDAPVDIGIASNGNNVVTPIVGEALPVQGLVLFLDHRWNTEWTTSVGYSRIDIDNTDAMDPSAFKSGQYAIGNILYRPTPSVMMGAELQWGERENFTDGFTSDDFRVQFSFKYNFGMTIGGK